MSMISPTMLLDPTMDLCLWKLTAYRKANGNTKARTKIVDLLEAVSGQVAGYMVGDVAVVAPTKAKARGRQRGNQTERKEIKKVDPKERKEAAEVKCSNCMEFGHWSRDCPNMSANNVAQKDSVRQELIPPNQATPAAKSTATARRIFQFGGTPSNPSSPTFPTPLFQARMVLFHAPDCDSTEGNGEEGDHE